ncbi:MAG TPA: endonuclease III [Myxococcaceae bacterium]|jgi:endonuclease-3|nr:endonuclease III [Myxococcaceae bacterium]
MARETVDERKARAVNVIARLDEAMPDAHIELDYQTPLQLVTAVILAAQCTDKRVNMVTPALFKRYPDARALAGADAPELEKMIHSCGFFRAKAKALKGMAAAVAEQHGGEVPTARAELAALPGVGPKTAGVVTVHLGGEPAFPVDTHVKRLSRRLGFTRHEDPSRIEEDLQALLPPELWGKGHQLLVWHGRRTCFARSPACERCVVRDLCPRIGVAKAKATVVKSARPPRSAAVVPPAPGRRRATRRKPRSARAAR